MGVHGHHEKEAEEDHHPGEEAGRAEADHRQGPEPQAHRVAVAERLSALEVKGDRLVVRISKDTHPEIFDIDRLMKAVCKVIGTYEKKRKMRDLVEFLSETEKSLEIILSNHLEDALRKYLK
jgi:hypothetical protein